MDAELTRLLDEARSNISNVSGTDNESSSASSVSQGIPKLQTRLTELDSPNKGESDVHLKAVPVPRDRLPQKPDTAGAKWFDLSRPEMTPEVKRDLQLLRMRHVLDPKRFYKQEKAAPPKYFAVGTVKEDPSEFYSSRLTRKERKSTLAEEILGSSRADYYRSKYKQIQNQKQSGRKKYQKKIRNMRA